MSGWKYPFADWVVAGWKDHSASLGGPDLVKRFREALAKADAKAKTTNRKSAVTAPSGLVVMHPRGAAAAASTPAVTLKRSQVSRGRRTFRFVEARGGLRGQQQAITQEAEPHPHK
jgi:hypothetical protein